VLGGLGFAHSVAVTAKGTGRATKMQC
jgi:hypothetical protein